MALPNSGGRNSRKPRVGTVLDCAEPPNPLALVWRKGILVVTSGRGCYWEG